MFLILMYIYRAFQNTSIYNILHHFFLKSCLSFKICKKIHKSFLTLNPSILIYMEKVIKLIEIGFLKRTLDLETI